MVVSPSENGRLFYTGAENVIIKRFVSQDKMNDGTKFDALITVKESVEHGHRIYSLELDEINKATLRWTVNDDGTLTPENEPSTGNLNNKVTDNSQKVKSIFERVQLYHLPKTEGRFIDIHCYSVIYPLHQRSTLEILLYLGTKHNKKNGFR